MQSVDFILKVFSELESKNMRYGIMRKSDEIEKGLAHDIDMVLDFSKLSQALIILQRVALDMGWIKILCADKDGGNLKTVHYANIGGEKPEIVHFDFFSNFSWNGISILDNNALLKDLYKKNRLYCVSYENEIVIKLLSRLIYHGYIKDEYMNEIQAYAVDHKENFIVALKVCLDDLLAIDIVNACSNGGWKAVEAKKADVREACATKCNHVSKVKTVAFKLRRVFKPQGVMVAFLGTDGSGKSTIIDGLPAYIGNTFDDNQIKYYHWRPGFIKSPKGEKSGSKSNTTEPHKLKPYSKPISLIKFLYFNLDYIFGYWLSVRKHLVKNELVVFDRYYYDYYLDKYRYRFDVSDRIVYAFSHTIPKPDITFLLVGDPKILYERKKELSVEELDKQIQRLKESQKKIPYSKIVDVNQTIETVLNCVSKEILKFMAGLG